MHHPDLLHGKEQHHVFVASAGAHVPNGLHAGLKEGDMQTCQMRCMHACMWDAKHTEHRTPCGLLQGKVQHYVFVASAGAYVPDVLHAGLKEGDKRKESAGHVPVEQYLQSEGLPYTIFQPLYIYGPHTGKVHGNNL